MFFLISFLIGISIGSFLNVVIFRLTPEKETSVIKELSGRSRCHYCQKELAWYELIPLISFVIQNGKCRSCHHKLSWQYPIVEFLTGLSFLAVVWKFSKIFYFTGFLPGIKVLILIILFQIIFSLLILIAVYDFKYYLIPAGAVYVLFLTSLILNFYYFYLQKINFLPDYGLNFSGVLNYLLFTPQNIFLKLLMALLPGIFTIGFAYIFSKGKAMGLGDVLLILALSLIFLWPDILIVLFLSFVLGTIVSLILIIFKRKTLKDIVPFAPFLALGAFIAFLFSDIIINNYLLIFPNVFL
ncbi:MAG TPA: prepilin peptidase [Candidatus Paceibacterota bacterium]|jgi:prepilin signal peptidase PulO-like enzyme (type II secretory pathway)|nr:prepilin peptidase [Candidatus Paceibacterota bacterium]